MLLIIISFKNRTSVETQTNTRTNTEKHTYEGTQKNTDNNTNKNTNKDTNKNTNQRRNRCDNRRCSSSHHILPSSVPLSSLCSQTAVVEGSEVCEGGKKDALWCGGKN